MTRRKPQGQGLALGLSPSWLATSTEVQRILTTGINPDGSLTSEAIRALLRFKGVEITPLAEEFGVSHQYFHLVINRRRPDRRVQDLIAAKLGLDPDQVWGRQRASAA